VLSGRVVNNPTGQPTNGNGYEEDMGYRTMTSEDAAILRQNNGIGGHTTPSAQTPTSQTNQNNIPQSPPTPQGHHRTSRWVIDNRITLFLYGMHCHQSISLSTYVLISFVSLLSFKTHNTRTHSSLVIRTSLNLLSSFSLIVIRHSLIFLF